ncbi:MAG: PAS domain S-box protein, partial [Bacteroidales bacterium]|nr:PAS domain S-box protein [Bacteroidales bacterium]
MKYTTLFLGNSTATYERLQACSIQEIIHIKSAEECECHDLEMVLLLVELENFGQIVSHEKFFNCFRIAVLNGLEAEKRAHIECFNDILLIDAPEYILRMRFDLYHHAMLAETTMRYNHDKYKEFFYQNRHPVLLLDQKGVIIEMNEKFLQISEYSESELYYKSITNVFHDFDFELNKDKEIVMVNLISKQGKIKTKELQISKIFIDNEVAYLVVCHDISEQISYVKKIQYDEIRFRSIIENTPYGLIVFKDNIISYINESAIAILGGVTLNYVKKDLSQLIIPNQKTDFEKFIAKHQKNPTNDYKKFTFLTINNEEVFVKLYCKSLSFSNEYLILFQDISELVKSQELVSHQEYYMNELQNMTKVGHYEVDFKLKTIYWSREMYSIFNVKSQTFTPSLHKIWQRVS